ncbi:helicase related [Holotrichia oblita]|uniref:Helicase related n=1 Tax=Holotrichia oblita TaxID=644536 RepID=A0ACB9T8A5_HOLOL|nr:helicase related [Holotrichia oblita]
MYQLKRFDETYSFIGIDACLEPGPRRPFNFVGIIDKAEIEEINKITDIVKTSGSNYTVWFGHFPTSCILATEGNGVKSIIGQLDQSLVYVCGHLHTLGGLIPNMYTLQKDGF